VQTSGSWQPDAQFPGEQWLGDGASEQQSLLHSLSAPHPSQMKMPLIDPHVCPLPHFQPQTPQSLVVFATTFLPLQHIAFAFELLVLVPLAFSTGA
jgi:hypothetical protein